MFCGFFKLEAFDYLSNRNIEKYVYKIKAKINIETKMSKTK